MGGAVQQCGHSVGIRAGNGSLVALRNPLYRRHPKHSGGGATTRRRRHMGGGESRRPWVARRLRNRQGTGVSAVPVYQVHDVLCSQLPDRLPAMGLPRIPAMRENLATGLNECRALIDTMVAAAAKAKPPLPAAAKALLAIKPTEESGTSTRSK